MPATYEPIATATVSSSTVSFTNIPSTYTDLIVVGVIQTSGTLRVNDDSGSTYSETRLIGNGSTASSTRAANYTGGWDLTNASNPTSTAPGLCTWQFFNYASTSVNKTALYSFNNDQNGSGNVEQCVLLWRSTSAINKLAFTQTSFTGTVTLYGILKA
jgi:hypothetical protein